MTYIDDLINRLRTEGCLPPYYAVPGIQRSAAAALEWMRDEGIRARTCELEWQKSCLAAEAEVARIREALRSAQAFIADGGYAEQESGRLVYAHITAALAQRSE